MVRVKHLRDVASGIFAVTWVISYNMYTCKRRVHQPVFHLKPATTASHGWGFGARLVASASGGFAFLVVVCMP